MIQSVRKQYSKLLIFVVVVAIIVSCGRPKVKRIAYIEDTSWASVRLKNKLVIGISDDVPILSYRNNKKQLIGYDIDIFTEICNRLDIIAEFYPIDWDKKEFLLNNSIVDCIASGFSITEYRRKHYTLLTPYLQNVQVLVTRTHSCTNMIKDLQNKKIGVTKGSMAEQSVPAMFQVHPKPIVLTFSDIDVLFSNLDSGRVEAIVCDLLYSCNRVQDYNKYKLLKEALSTEYYTFAFRKTDTMLAQKIETVLKKMNNDGTVAKLSKKWFGLNLSVLGM